MNELLLGSEHDASRNRYPQAGKNGIDRTLSCNSFFTIMVRSSLKPPILRRSPIMVSARARAAALSDSTVPSGSYVSVAVRRAMKKYRGMLRFPLTELATRPLQAVCCYRAQRAPSFSQAGRTYMLAPALILLWQLALPELMRGSDDPQQRSIYLAE